MNAYPVMVWCGIILSVVAAAYAVVACIAANTRVRSSRFTPRDLPGVTILKPLHGAEPETYACLRSFCDQAYPNFQIVFGVCDPSDPVLQVVARLQAEFPALDLRVAVDRRQHGSSRKVSNLINMMPLASHECLVLSDSDVRVGRDYLSRLVRPLLDSSVGIVTCLYRGYPRQGLWPLLGSLFINDWFMPSVRVAALGGSRAFAFGATIAMRREVLDRIGGFMSIADQLADDYRLGELTRRLGLRTVLSEVVVDTWVAERSFRELVRHELRWLRTIRALRPMAYGFLFITFGVPVAALGALLAGGATPAVSLFAVTVLGRVGVHWSMRRKGSNPLQVLALPVRDALSLGLWLWSFINRQVQWREHRYQVMRDGAVQLIEDPEQSSLPAQ